MALADVHHHFRVMFRPTNTNWSSRSAEAAAIVQDTRQEYTRPATNAHLLETQGPRDEIIPTKNVASRAYFDAASRTAASRACGSQYVHVDGTSRLDASRRCRPSAVTSAVGAVRAIGRRGASGGIAGGGWCRRRLSSPVGGRNRHFPFLDRMSSSSRSYNSI